MRDTNGDPRFCWTGRDAETAFDIRDAANTYQVIDSEQGEVAIVYSEEFAEWLCKQMEQATDLPSHFPA